MNKINGFNKKRIPFIIIASIHFIFTFFTDRLYFTPISEDSTHILSFILVKILLFLVLNLFWQMIFEISLGKNEKIRSIFKYAMVYFIPMMVLLLFIWPGPLADGDISYFMNHEEVYSYNYYLHYLTSLVHIIGLMILPFLTGILIFQNFCYSLIVGYVVYRGVNFFRSKLAYLIYLVFIIPSIAYFSLYINRTPIYGYIYILFLSILIFDFLEKKALNIGKIFSLVLLASILVVLRYEGIYLIITAPILIFIAYRLEFKLRDTGLLILAIIITMNIINIPQKKWEKLYEGNYTYKRLRPAIVHSLSNMLEYDIEGDFEVIDRVMSVEIMREHRDLYNITPFSMGVEREDFTDEDEQAFIEESIRIFLRNPLEFLKVRFKTLHITSLHSKDSVQNFTYFNSNYGDRSLFTEELFPETRDKVLKVLVNNPEEGPMSFRSEKLKKIGNLKNLISYNLYITIFIVSIISIISLIRLNWFWLLISLGLLGHGAIIFLLAPATFFMYYLPIHMVAWLLVVLFFISFFTKSIFYRKEDLFG